MYDSAIVNEVISGIANGNLICNRSMDSFIKVGGSQKDLKTLETNSSFFPFVYNYCKQIKKISICLQVASKIF